VREFVGDRRRASRRNARLSARLPFTVKLLDIKEESAGNVAAKISLAGHTSDLSETGLTLLLPFVRIGGTYLTDREHYLGIKLELPEGIVALLATPIRFEDRSGAGSEFRYLLGVRIIRIEEADRARYLAYLRTLSLKERRSRKPKQGSDNATAPLAQSAGRVNTWANLTPAHVSEAFEKFLRDHVHPRQS
jgi:hypothetical protein